MTISKESEIDALKLYFGEPFVIENDTYNDIIINQPTIGDIIKSGEKKIYSTINIFIANPTMYRMQLWDLGIDWNKMSDFSLFCMLVPSIDSKSTKLLFGDLNFQLFQLQQTQTEDGEPFFYLLNEEQNVQIDEAAYLQMASYLRAMFNTYPKMMFTNPLFYHSYLLVLIIPVSNIKKMNYVKLALLNLWTVFKDYKFMNLLLLYLRVFIAALLTLQRLIRMNLIS